MKQFTTPSLQLTIHGAEEILSGADKVILTISDGDKDINLTPRVEGNVLTAVMRQEQTARLESGTLYIEATIVVGDKVFKTKTLEASLDEAVKNKVV